MKAIKSDRAVTKLGSGIRPGIRVLAVWLSRHGDNGGMDRLLPLGSAGANRPPIFRTLTDVYDEFSEEMRFSYVTLFVTPIGMRVMASAQALLRTQVARN